MIRIKVAGVSTILGGLLLAVPPFLGPPNSADSTHARLIELAANPGPATAKSLVFQIAVVLLLPGIAALGALARGRGSLPVVLGAFVYGFGVVGAFAFALTEGMQVTIAQSGPITDSLVDAADSLEGGAAVIPMFVLAFLFFHLIGLPLLTVGLAWARTIPWWLAAVATAGSCAAFFGSGTPVESAGWVAQGAALTGIGWSIVRRPERAIAYGNRSALNSA